MLGRGYRFSLSQAVDAALEQLGPKIANVKRKAGEPAPREQVLEFFRGRLKALWTEQYRTDVVEAVLSAGFDDLVAAHKRLRGARQHRGPGGLRAPGGRLQARGQHRREAGQGRGPRRASTPAASPTTPSASSTRPTSRPAARVAELVKADDFSGALKEITGLKPAVDTFFDKVMVMAEDKELRENRIRLLTEIGALFNQVADFSKIQAEA